MKLLLILLPLVALAVAGCSSYDPVAGRVFNNVSPYIAGPKMAIFIRLLGIQEIWRMQAKK
jgi:hypothetical protein